MGEDVDGDKQGLRAIGVARAPPLRRGIGRVRRGSANDSRAYRIR